MMVRDMLVFVLLGLLSLVCSQVLVDTEYGPVQGQTIADVWNGEFSADVNSFLGVPYGKDTSGQLRFAKPEKADPWLPDVFIADTLGMSCAQSGGGLFIVTHPGWDNFGEDCLNINIYTPTTAGPHPVMVWFHGGAYTGGANIQYPGYFLATRNVVMVTVNYRLNDFGFAYTASDAAPGNQGMWDQKLALEFVRDNIANFGGDPNAVTIFGQSAGASSSSLHMVSPESQGLAHQAILESGTESNFWSINYPESNPETYIWQLAGEVNCSEGNDDNQMIECLRQLPWEAIRDASFKCTPGHFCQGMAPVVDGPGGFLPEKPADLRASGNFMKGPIITGITKDDGSFYTLSVIPESLLGGFNRTMFHHYLRERMLAFWTPQLDNETAEDLFQAVDYNYSPWPYVEDEYANREAINQFITDAAFGYPWDKQLKNHNTYAATFGYVYDYRSVNIPFPEWMGVPHIGELPSVWGFPLLKYNEAVRNDSGILFDFVEWTDEDLRHAIYWQTLYANFAHTGNPTFTPVQDPLGGVTNWRPFSEEDMAFLYVNNETVGVQTLWEQRDYAFWREYISYITRDYAIPIVDYESARVVSVATEAEGIDSTWMEMVTAAFYEIIAEESFSDFDWE